MRLAGRTRHRDARCHFARIGFSDKIKLRREIAREGQQTTGEIEPGADHGQPAPSQFESANRNRSLQAPGQPQIARQFGVDTAPAHVNPIRCAERQIEGRVERGRAGANSPVLSLPSQDAGPRLAAD